MSNALERRDSTRTMFPSLVNFFPDMKSWSVGFDREWDILEDLQDSFSRGLPAYPPYNIKKKSKNEYEIEMAVAGFDRQDLQVEVKNNQIVVEGNKGFRNESSDIDYIYKGIASRHFRQSFALADHLEVTHAEFKDGILRITLKGEFLQEEPAHKIAID